MSRYSITVLGKSEDGIDYKFCVGYSLPSDDVARRYANDVALKRMEQNFVGNWWIEKIMNDSTGKRVLLRDE